MASSADTKLQINYKLPNGDLINVYAKDQAELEAGLTSIIDCSELIRSVQNTLSGRPGITQVDPWTIKEAVGTVANTLGGEAVPSCKHGYRELKSGISKAGKPYKVQSCPSKDRNDQCAPVWVN